MTFVSSVFGGVATALAAAALLAPSAWAQRAELAADRVPYAWRSDTRAPLAQPGVRAAHTVRIDGARWLRLRFDSIELAPGAVLRLTSLADGATQHLNATTAAQWQNTSAYFNGAALKVELLGAEGASASRIAIGEVMAGRLVAEPESQCGTSDDRVPSNAGNRARLLDIGCTANLTADGCFITAGHCLADASAVDVVEFNVPPSTATGGLVHPPPSSQYIPTTTRQFSNNGIGNDWGVFTVFPNSETGLTPLQAQGPGLDFSGALPKRNDTVEITGYGTDSSSANQTQQVATGPVRQVSTSTTTLKYAADTEGGNSGSAVLVGGLVVAIHTNGGCRVRGGANSGTLIGNAAFQSAYQQVCGAPPTLLR